MLGRAGSGIVSTLILAMFFSILFPIRTDAIVEQSPVSTPVPYVPDPNSVTLSHWIEAGFSYMNTTIELPTPCFNVSDWGTPSNSGNTISVNSEIWAWTGICLQVVTPVSYVYSLGYLPKGEYFFVLEAWGTPAMSITFDVYENVTTHEGDLVIGGTQTLIIENCTYVQTGNVFVKDWATILVKNATIKINLTYAAEYYAIFQDRATVEIMDSVVTSQSGFDFSLGGQVKADISDSDFNNVWVECRADSVVGIISSKLVSLHVWDRSKVQIGESEITWTINLDLPSYRKISISNLNPGFYEYWNLEEVLPDVSHSIVLRNTTVGSWSLVLDYSNAAIVSDSIIERMRIEFRDILLNLRNVAVGHFNNWTFGGIALENTSVRGHWHFELFNCSGTISNSDIWVSLITKGTMSVIDSHIGFDSFVDFAGNVFFDNSTVIHLGRFMNSRCYIGGFVKLSPSMEGLISTNVTRNYNVIARNTSGNAVENVKLTLLGHGDAVIWNGVADSLGETDFNLTFTDSNYTDTLRLDASKGNLSSTIYVGFLSDTPLVLTLLENVDADLNGDGTVNILDIFIVARAFGAKPGDPNWDQIADMDKSGVIDILDVFAVARDYGKTV